MKALWQSLRLKLRMKLRRDRVQTPTLLQMEAVECGAAALGIILSYHDLIVPLAELRQECGVSRDGSKASNLLKAARHYGMKAKGFKKPLDALRSLPVPYIVFWNFNHFLVVEGFSRDRVYLNDPATGPRHVSFEEFDEGYTGVVLVMEPGEDFEPGGTKPSIILSLWQRLRGALGALLFCIAAGFLLVIPGLAIPAFSQIFIDNILIEEQLIWLRPLLVGMAISIALQGLIKLLQLRYLRKLKLKLSVSHSSQFFWHVLRLPVGFYAQRFAGEISSRVQVNDKVAEVLSEKLTATVIDAVMAFGYAIVMFAYDWQLTFVGIFFAVVNIVLLQWVSRRRVDTNLRLVYDWGKASGVSIAALQSIETIKSSASESDFFVRWAGYYAKYLNARQVLGAIDQMLGVLPSFLQSLTTALILVLGGFRVMNGELSIGMLVAFIALMESFQDPIESLVNFGSTFQELGGDLNRLDDVLQNEPDPQLEEAERSRLTFATPKLQGYLELKNITFGYTPIDAPLIEDLSFSLQPGQRVALVGGSGSGKSTIAKLICGLYEPWEGEILLDGIERSQIPRSFLADSIAMVEQDIFLFSGTVRDNLTLWDDTVPDASVIRACRDAAIHEVILSLPGGYRSELSEGGGNLSGGQQQRFEIARALVNDPSILVLDEATSALDAETERIIDRNLRRRGCTCAIVAHRLSTIRDCDEIIVLDRGQVVQRGTHEELWHSCDAYARSIRAETSSMEE